MAEKYFGILKNFDFDNVCENFNELIESGIYDIQDCDNCENWIDEGNMNFSYYYENRNKKYNFKNEVYYEIIEKIINFLGTLNLQDEIQDEINKINSKVKKEFLLEKKIILLENIYKSEYKKLNKDDYTSLKENMYLDIIYTDNRLEGFISFFKGTKIKLTDIAEEIEWKEWKEIYRFEQISNYLNNLIIDLTEKKEIQKPLEEKIEIQKTLEKKPKIDIQNNELSKLIFKEKGLSLFKFIYEKYPKQKNPAFFSYLYFYLKDKFLLLASGEDNIDYRDYVMKAYDLKTFSRIQKPKVNNPYKKNDLENLFNSFYNEFELNRSE
jgi:hypothetical protein